MPLFGKRRHSADRDTTVHDQEHARDDRPARKGSIFSRNRSHSALRYDDRDNTRDTHNSNGKAGGFFSRKRSSSTSDNSPRRDDTHFARDTHDHSNGNRGGFFSRRRSSSASDSSSRRDGSHDTRNTHDHSYGKRGGFFSRRRSSSSSDHSPHRDSSSVAGSTSTGGGGGLFGNRKGGRTLHNPKFSKDPSILAARQRITEAEEAERAADQALIDARNAAKNARGHCKNLEREAEEE